MARNSSDSAAIFLCSLTRSKNPSMFSLLLPANVNFHAEIIFDNHARVANIAAGVHSYAPFVPWCRVHFSLCTCSRCPA